MDLRKLGPSKPTLMSLSSSRNASTTWERRSAMKTVLSMYALLNSHLYLILMMTLGQAGSDDEIDMNHELSDGGNDNTPTNSETNLHQNLTPLQIPKPNTPNQCRSKRACTNKSFGTDQEDCVELDCDDPSSHEEKIRCDGPGCNAMVRISFVVLCTQTKRR